jgi:hypothetical protein
MRDNDPTLGDTVIDHAYVTCDCCRERLPIDARFCGACGRSLAERVLSPRYVRLIPPRAVIPTGARVHSIKRQLARWAICFIAGGAGVGTAVARLVS